MCDIEGCNDVPVWYDESDNQLCADCQLTDMYENDKPTTDYEAI